MNKRHCKRVAKLGGNADLVYNTLNDKMEQIWRRRHPDLEWVARRLDPDLASYSHAMELFDGEDNDFTELLLARAGRNNDTILLSRLVEAL